MRRFWEQTVWALRRLWARVTPRREEIIVGGDTALHLSGMPVPLLALLALLFEKAKRVVTGFPRNCNSRMELYRYGAKMLNKARVRVTAVSTIRDEDFPSRPVESVADENIRAYFVSLHKIAYANRLSKRAVSLVRYSDLTDPDKCHEGLSLLYYGAGVELRPSKVPVEFVTVDDRSTLIGFPTATELYGGFHSFNPRQSKAMSAWIEAHGATAPALAAGTNVSTPTQLLQHLRETAAPAHPAGCLCQIVNVLGDSSPTAECATQYNKMSAWYAGLYHHVPEKAAFFYSKLAKELHEATGRSHIEFLDVGCGVALGAEALAKHHCRYWGLDVASGMVEKGPQFHPNIATYQCDAIGALMGADKNAVRFTRDAPRRFDVIACQGNTFDYFLGAVQKALALFTFDQRLNENGVLLFTGHPFERDKTEYHRLVPDHRSPGEMLNVVYDLKWYGDYCKMVIHGTSIDKPGLLLHPTDRSWLREFLGKMGYVELNLGIQWYGPSGGEDYQMWVFQKKSDAIVPETQPDTLGGHRSLYFVSLGSAAGLLRRRFPTAATGRHPRGRMKWHRIMALGDLIDATVDRF